ncbi:MAG: hypothetical protein KAH21_10360 [Spirochaetaceae bacterium]|nr:hypothetical protein [Spirochaetaceae bacterium]
MQTRNKDAKIPVMNKRVRITTVEKHEVFRQDDMRRMTPKDRVDALMEFRDELYPYSSLERTVSYRILN